MTRSDILQGQALFRRVKQTDRDTVERELKYVIEGESVPPQIQPKNKMDKSFSQGNINAIALE